MTENSYLDPSLIKNQCTKAISNINQDLGALEVAQNAIQDFLDDDSLKAISFDKLKESMVQYKYYITQLVAADQEDIQDFNNLSTYVEAEVLDGSIILPNKKAADDSKKRNESTAERYRNSASSASNPLEAAYYSGMAWYYSCLADNDYKTYLYWLGKEQKYDSIENSTKNLFQSSAYYRLNCIASPNESIPCALEFGSDLFGDSLKESLAQKLEQARKDKEFYEKAVSSSDPTQLTADEKEAAIRYYESTHRDHSSNMNKAMQTFYEAGYDDDATNIKILAYTAEEPYRSAFINNCADVKVKDIHYQKTCHYSPSEKGIYINVSRFANKNAAAYNVYFHEISHGIDDNYSKNGKAMTAYYTNSAGQTTNQVLEREVRGKVIDYAKNELSAYGLNEQEEAEILKRVENDIMNRIDNKVDAPLNINDPVEKSIYDSVVKQISNELSGKASAGDIYGGLTGNTLYNGCRHEATTKTNPDGTVEYRLYWVEGTIASDGSSRHIDTDSNGNVKYTDHVSSEFFAENMAANMTRESKEMAGYNYYSDESRKIFNEIVNQIK